MAGGDEDDPSDPAYWNKFLGEGHTPFEPEPADKPGLGTLRSLYAAVLTNYDHTCAMTGQVFAPPDELLHDGLEITPIRPLHLGGTLHVNNFLCLEREAAHAFRGGHIAIGPRSQLLVDLSQIDPELLERLNPLGFLNEPNAVVGKPDVAAIAFHRENIFTGSSSALY